MDVDALTQAGELLVSSIIQNQPIDHIKQLIKDGAPLWYQNEDEGMSPLHAAAYMQNEHLVKFLIEQGAVWNAGPLVFTSSCPLLIRSSR